MSPRPGSASATAAGLRRCHPAATAATGAPALTCTVAAGNQWRPVAPRGPHGVLIDARTQHRYQTCHDEDCQRFACRVYREGYHNGREQGKAEGYAAGEAAGYAKSRTAGYSAGMAAAGG